MKDFYFYFNQPYRAEIIKASVNASYIDLKGLIPSGCSVPEAIENLKGAKRTKLIPVRILLSIWTDQTENTEITAWKHIHK